MTPALSIENLSVNFRLRNADVAAVRDASLSVQAAECVAVVGESGSGKTQSFLAAMGLLPAAARAAGSVRFEGQEILGAAPALLNRIRGSKLTMIFQDPMTSLTPHLRIGVQLAEVLVSHAHLAWRDAERGARDMLERVQVPQAARRMRQYPHELSGGLRQRAMIAMSLLCEPAVMIADEPTTALDVTVQAQILDLLRGLRDVTRTAIVLISHDIGVVAGLANRIVVMYGGRVVENGTADEVLHKPLHPYSRALLDCVPRVRGPRQGRMASLPGRGPNAADPETGCAFAPRCVRAAPRCRSERPLLRTAHTPGGAPHGAPRHAAACHYPNP